MKFIVNIPGRATADADEIYVWIAKRSPQGALQWHLAYLAAAASLSDTRTAIP
jgi:plasmid stabilization system protein ParE